MMIIIIIAVGHPRQEALQLLREGVLGLLQKWDGGSIHLSVYPSMRLLFPADNTEKGARQPGALQSALRHDAWEPTRVWPSGKTQQLQKYTAHVSVRPSESICPSVHPSEADLPASRRRRQQNGTDRGRRSIAAGRRASLRGGG